MVKTVCICRHNLHYKVPKSDRTLWKGGGNTALKQIQERLAVMMLVNRIKTVHYRIQWQGPVITAMNV
jgi:hypothetical protein